ncbi:piggyBac transposable element-derived protein 4-like [Xyrichtys novacula]|uniref:PiggyBac transposable element-derived protein 4-like n=1 Tax=Xyrichtys novacula TaxID=13765 RepID=A0AAV1HP41_XYRNO|nr:piggyBac transposable element-derived protein 4-like [Xyrichtys novacula]
MDREGEDDEEEEEEEGVIAGEREEQAKEGLFFLSKHDKIIWSSIAYDKQEQGRKDKGGEAMLPPSPLMQSSLLPPTTGPPEPTEYSLVHARDIASTFFMFITPSIERKILEMTNLEGRQKIGDGWKRMDITVYEQLVPFTGRCPFRQYIPSKPAKYGIKTWVACDSKTSYAWKMQVYTGKAMATDADAAAAAGGGGGGGGGGRRRRRRREDSGPCAGHDPEKNLGMQVLHDVTEGLRDRNVTCDNFFTSYELGQQLLKRKMTMVGTVRKKKPENLPYVPKKNKNVLLVSTKHTEAEVTDCHDRKPVIILDYNRCKGGVDNLDKVIGTYSCRRMTARWPLVVFHNIVDVSSYNAFVIWRELNPEWMPQKRNKRRVFLERLGKALVTPLIERRERLPRTEVSAAVVRGVRRAVSRSRTRGEGEDVEVTEAAGAASGADDPTGARKRCQFCPRAKDNKTSTVCSGCKKYICKSCSLPYRAECAAENFETD